MDRLARWKRRRKGRYLRARCHLPLCCSSPCRIVSSARERIREGDYAEAEHGRQSNVPCSSPDPARGAARRKDVPSGAPGRIQSSGCTRTGDEPARGVLQRTKTQLGFRVSMPALGPRELTSKGIVPPGVRPPVQLSTERNVPQPHLPRFRWLGAARSLAGATGAAGFRARQAPGRYKTSVETDVVDGAREERF
jgi:hypothetical protein